MGGRLNVEQQELDRLPKQPNTSRTGMRKALNALRTIGPKSTGSKALDNACEEIHDSRDDAIDKIDDGTDAIGEMLESTKDNHAATEQATREAFQKARPGPSPRSRPSPRPAGEHP
ncbi:hypothetical protein [Streptomyces megasporus]|uniref:hypothetical protein n=1 Tax=Streptomyces megasporus TaxID=44060 RepID=UPI0004E1FF94|nr:hypothetical protein [Streptomyces megasporus]